jgi:hypothetical protein
MKPETQAAGCRTSPPLCSVRTDLEIIRDKLMSLIESNLPDGLEDLVDSAEWEVQAAIYWVDEHAPNAGGQIPPASGGNLDRLVGHSES